MLVKGSFRVAGRSLWNPKRLRMTRGPLIISLLLNFGLLCLLAFLAFRDPALVTYGKTEAVRVRQLYATLVERHAEEVLGDLVGRAMVESEAAARGLEVDEDEVESTWSEWLYDPEVVAKLDSGDTTELEYKERLRTLVLLDQITWNDVPDGEREVLLEDYFERNQEHLTRVRLRHILLDRQTATKDVVDRLEAGVDFSELAQRFSLDPLTRERGGDLGWKTKSDFPTELSAVIFLLPVGAVSGAVSSPIGWHIFLVEERRETLPELVTATRRAYCRAMRSTTLARLKESSGLEIPDLELVESRMRNVLIR